jgi:spore maturation protein CgeB
VRILCVFGRHAYGDPARGEGYEHANFLPALAALGHEARLFESFDRRAYRDFAELNRRFLETVVDWRPQVVLTVLMHYELWPQTLALARERCGAAVVNWGTDDSWKYAQFSRHFAGAVDAYATTSHAALAAARREGLGNFTLTQWAASDAALAAPLPASACRHPVSFVGAAYGRRRRWVASLAARGIEVACFGHGWPSGPVDTATLRAITRESVVSLNFADASGGGAQIKARVFEVPGGGGLLLTQSAPHLRDYYAPGKEIEVFDSEEELAEKVQGLLADPQRRDAIAQAGHARTRREHTYTARFRALLPPARAGAGASCAFPEAEVRAMEGEHALSAGLRLLRALLVLPFSLAWGRERGGRVARRLFYEASWRIAGARIYGPRGWPGRMFYRES